MTTDSSDVYVSPLVERVASTEMARLWSPQRKFSTWRRCWLALAEAEQELGLPITDAQIEAMRHHLDDIDFEVVRQYEEKTRHDVMAHIHAFGDVAPEARPILHLGATSCYVTDNTDLILLREAIDLILTRALNVLHKLADFAHGQRDLPTLGYTHFQPAQVVTVGKRACLWAQDLLMDIESLEWVRDKLRCRGAKGTTGTQASFLALFDGDKEKVSQLDDLVASKLGFTSSYPITGQTYTRKTDTYILQALSGIGESAHKFATDIRLLQNLKEMEEPFGKNQVGSSAMAYKRNPMRAERICALSRFLMVSPLHSSFTTAVQWFERTLDDSAIRRLSLPEAFLACDGILNLYLSIMEEPVLYPKVIERHLMAELPFMATENILMACVKRGADRQEMHEIIRQHAQDAAAHVKQQGLDNDLLERLAADGRVPLNADEIVEELDVHRFVGCAPEQVDRFLAENVLPILDTYRNRLGTSSDVRV